MLLERVVETSRRVTQTSRRLEKIELIAGLLRLASPDEIETVVAFLSGYARQGKIGVGYATLRELGTKELAVRSAVDLPEETRKKIGAILQDRLGASPQLTFEKDSAMAWGIELRGNGHKIGWAPESYLDSLEENLKQALDRQAEAVDRDVVQVKSE